MTPNENFLGHKTPLSLLQKDSFATTFNQQNCQPHNIQNLLQHVQKLNDHIERIQAKVHPLVKQRRENENRRRNRQEKRIWEVHFGPGDWVLISSKDTTLDNDKIKLKWIGPYMITEIISQNVYQVRNLLGEEQEMHESRMWFYAPVSFQPGPELQHIFTHDRKQFEVESFGRMRFNNRQWEIKTKWRGLTEKTWEPIENMAEALPGLFQEALQTSNVCKIKQAIMEFLQKLPPNTAVNRRLQTVEDKEKKWWKELVTTRTMDSTCLYKKIRMWGY